MFFWKKKQDETRKEKEYQFSSIGGMDEYTWKAALLIIEQLKCSEGMLQRYFKIGYNRAHDIIEQLCDIGVVGERNGYKPREILVDKNGLIKISKDLSEKGYQVAKQQSAINSGSDPLKQSERVQMYNNQYDYMTGEDFEAYVAMILRQIGFVNVQLTKGSGDQGVDIIAEKDGMKYAFQCKRYDKPVGNKAVQEVFAGKFFYHCHAAVVVTNNYFAQLAKDLAYENGVVLWDREFLNKYGGKLDNSTERQMEKAEDSIFEKYYFINEDIVQFSLKKGNVIEILSICKNCMRAENLYFSFYTRLKDDYKGALDYHIAIQYENLLAIAQSKNGEEMLFGKGDSGEIEIGVPLWMNDARNQLLNKDNKEFMKAVSEAYSAVDEFIDLSKKYF